MSVKEQSIVGGLRGMRKDRQSVTKDWEPLQEMIDGVTVTQMSTVFKDGGALTEIYRDHWGTGEVRHVFQEILSPNKLTAWHMHLDTGTYRVPGT